MNYHYNSHLYLGRRKKKAPDMGIKRKRTRAESCQSKDEQPEPSAFAMAAAFHGTARIFTQVAKTTRT